MRSEAGRRALGGLALMLLAALAGAAGPQPADLFDFWLGDWDARWVNADGTRGSGRNHVARILDGRVLEERFEEDAGGSGPRLVGRSLSVRDAAGTWRQAWADNQGGFFALHAEVEGERRLFVTDATTDAEGRRVAQRMVFHAIGADAFTWDWERTRDGGTSWQRLWRIEYRRRPG